jgi:hypothetical protein
MLHLHDVLGKIVSGAEGSTAASHSMSEADAEPAAGPSNSVVSDSELIVRKVVRRQARWEGSLAFQPGGCAEATQVLSINTLWKRYRHC